jgi:hypothetical protein
MRVPGVTRRPVPGDFLTSTTVRVSADRIADRLAVAQDIQRHVSDFRARGMELSTRAFLRLVSQLRSGQYRRLASAVIRTQPVLSGFTFSPEPLPGIEKFLGAQVTNLWGSGVAGIPPGWNPCFNEFHDRMNFTLAWPESMFPERVAQRYAALIEEEVFGD